MTLFLAEGETLVTEYNMDAFILYETVVMGSNI